MAIISCVEVVKKIFELLDGKITNSEQRQLDEHVATCRECCDRLEFEKILKEKLQETNKEKKVPPSLAKRIDTLLKSF